MKATISSTGVLTITAENDTESYALSQWDKNSVIDVNDTDRNEQSYYKGSSIIVSFGKLYSNSIFGTVVFAGAVPFITGLDQYTKYKGDFVSDNGCITVDGISGEYGDIIAKAWDGTLNNGDLVRLRPN